MILLPRGADRQASDGKEALVGRQPDNFVSLVIFRSSSFLTYFIFVEFYCFFDHAAILEQEPNNSKKKKNEHTTRKRR